MKVNSEPIKRCACGETHTTTDFLTTNWEWPGFESEGFKVFLLNCRCKSTLALKIALIVLATGVGNGCGRDESGGGSSAEPVTLTESPSRLQSVALDSYSDLPKCESENETQLAYIKDEKQFYVCMKTSWEEIDPPSETKTLKGEKGDTGEEGETVTTNNWYDAVTGKLWLIGANAFYNQAELVCENTWRLPNKDEALAAAQRGLGIAAADISGPSTMWTSTPYAGNATNRTTIVTIATVPSEAEGIVASHQRGVICVEK